MESKTRPILDLAKRHKVLKRGDISIIFTWMATNGRPVMVLVPSFTGPTAERITPVLVPLDMAYLWDGASENHDHCLSTAFSFAASLGFNPMDHNVVHRIISLIQDHIDDLVMMPVRPVHDHKVVADAFRRNQETGAITHSEITDHV